MIPHHPVSSRFLATALVALSITGATADAPPVADVPSSASPPRVVELFTSHGCSSCPPAERLFERLVEAAPELVALEYHVDYWDALVHGADGSFADPFSSPAHTARQRAYAEAGLEGRPGVYTPQLVVDGRRAMVGSDERRLAAALAEAPAPSGASVRIGASADGAGRLAARVDGARPSDEVVLVRYLDEASTEITGGENRHRTAVNRRVVHAVEPLGTSSEASGGAFEFAAPPAGEGCAVLVQDRALAALRAAALCPGRTPG